MVYKAVRKGSITFFIFAAGPQSAGPRAGRGKKRVLGTLGRGQRLQGNVATNPFYSSKIAWKMKCFPFEQTLYFI